MKKNKIIGFDNSDNIGIGLCEWDWICYNCKTYYCSGCLFECPTCGSKQISTGNWYIYEIINEEMKPIFGTWFQWIFLRIKYWNERRKSKKIF